MSSGSLYKYCPQCGRALQTKLFDGQLRPYCEDCDRMYFEDPKVAAAVLVENDGKILLVRRAIAPHIGKWTLPAGFVDAREDPVVAAARECVEETGLTVRIVELLDVISGREHEQGADIVLVYRGEILAGQIESGTDVSEVAFFSHDQLPPVAFKATMAALSLWGNHKLSED